MYVYTFVGNKAAHYDVERITNGLVVQFQQEKNCPLKTVRFKTAGIFIFVNPYRADDRVLTVNIQTYFNCMQLNGFFLRLSR